MSLRPFWQRHPIALRFAGAATIIISPLLIWGWTLMLIWDDREDVVAMYRDAWRYMTGKEAQ